jgi:hypothetical protein
MGTLGGSGKFMIYGFCVLLVSIIGKF